MPKRINRTNRRNQRTQTEPSSAPSQPDVNPVAPADDSAVAVLEDDAVARQLAALNDHVAKLQVELGRLADRMQRVEKHFGLQPPRLRR